MVARSKPWPPPSLDTVAYKYNLCGFAERTRCYFETHSTSSLGQAHVGVDKLKLLSNHVMNKRKQYLQTVLQHYDTLLS